MTAAMTASLLTGMGAVTASAKKSDDGKRTKITALLNSTESTEQYQVYDYLLKNFCDEKGIDYEIEMVNDKQDYFTKLQMYINSDTLPDIFGCPNGTLSKACKDIDALVDLGAELDRNGYADKMNGAVRDFLTDADDGNLYLFPQGLYCEFFMYRKDLFEEAYRKNQKFFTRKRDCDHDEVKERLSKVTKNDLLLHLLSAGKIRLLSSENPPVPILLFAIAGGCCALAHGHNPS